MKTLLKAIALALWFPLSLAAQPTDLRNLVWYPNPATGEQDIRLRIDYNTPIQIHIFRADGMEVERLTLEPSFDSCHLLFQAGELAAGSYFARITYLDGRGQRVVHFIVQ